MQSFGGVKFSANLGFLWTDRSLPDAIFAAKHAGFDAVECHWPKTSDLSAIKNALVETGPPLLGLNTTKGGAKDNGLAAIPGREAEACAAIDEAIAKADALDAEAIHVMSGVAYGQPAEDTYLQNLAYATSKTDRMILIEPLNRHDAPGYFLHNTDQAADVISKLNAPNLKLMFDCYHVGRTEGDVIASLTKYMPLIGHIQFASVPDRGPPDKGDVNYREVFQIIEKLKWTRPLGAEYKPVGNTDDTLDWMQTL